MGASDISVMGYEAEQFGLVNTRSKLTDLPLRIPLGPVDRTHTVDGILTSVRSLHPDNPTISSLDSS